MNKEKMIGSINDAIVASGKKFKEISKDSFFAFFQKEGFNKNQWDSLYSELESIHGDKPKKKAIPEQEQSHFKQNVDYYTSAHNDVKKREPRKNIFGEIVKLAG